MVGQRRENHCHCEERSDVAIRFLRRSRPFPRGKRGVLPHQYISKKRAFVPIKRDKGTK